MFYDRVVLGGNTKFTYINIQVRIAVKCHAKEMYPKCAFPGGFRGGGGMKIKVENVKYLFYSVQVFGYL